MKKRVLRKYLKERETNTGITPSDFANKIISKKATEMVEEMVKGIKEAAKTKKKAKNEE